MNYAAFIRGIGPGDPAKSNASLIKVIESLGFNNVRSFISSGNILFETDEAGGLEKKIEEALTSQLGFKATAIIRSKKELETFVASQPFGDRKHSQKSYLIVTFFKANQHIEISKVPKDKNIEQLGYNHDIRALCNAVDTTASKTPDFMTKLERNFGKTITTRTFNTIQRVTTKL